MQNKKKSIEQAVRDGEITVNEVADAEEAAAAGGQQISIRDIYESLGDYSISEVLGPETMEHISNVAKDIQEAARRMFTIPEGLMKDLKEAAKRYDMIRPFFNMIADVYPDSAAFYHEPVGVVMAPIEVYMNEQGLHGATAEEQNTHKEGFLAFFAAYLEEWEAVKEQPDMAQAQAHIWDALRARGLIKGEAEEAAAEAMDTAVILTTGYAAMFYGPGFEGLAKIDSKRNRLETNHITGQRSISNGQFTVYEKGLVNAFEMLPSRISSLPAQKLLDICKLILTQKNKYGTKTQHTLIELPLTKYMELCGIPITKPSIDKTRRTLKEVLQAFNSVTLDWEEKRRGQKAEKYHLNILQKYSDIVNGTIYMQLTEDIADYLTHSYLMWLPLELLNEKNPIHYAIGKKLLMQYSNLHNQQSKTANIISVKALLKQTTGIPTYDEVMAAGKHLKQRIIQPFEKALNSLPYIEWQYCNAKYAPLTEEQQQNFNYDTFIGCYVHFKPLNAPDLMPRVEAKEAQKKALAEARQARTEARQKKAEGNAL